MVAEPDDSDRLYIDCWREVRWAVESDQCAGIGPKA